jgi:hypothetical protein
MDAINPLQAPRLAEIAAGRKFWGYLDTEALQSRYVLAAHFVRRAAHVVEIGGYRDNLITNFLRSAHESVTVFSLDAEFEPLERDTLNGGPCRVRHVRDYFQNHSLPRGNVAIVALGFEIVGDLAPFTDLLSRAEVAVIEIPPDHQPSVDCLERVRASVPTRLRCRINLDLASNEPLVQDELKRTNMNRPFWRRDMYVMERAQ